MVRLRFDILPLVAPTTFFCCWLRGLCTHVPLYDFVYFTTTRMARTLFGLLHARCLVLHSTLVNVSRHTYAAIPPRRGLDTADTQHTRTTFCRLIVAFSSPNQLTISVWHNTHWLDQLYRQYRDDVALCVVRLTLGSRLRRTHFVDTVTLARTGPRQPFAFLFC